MLNRSIIVTLCLAASCIALYGASVLLDDCGNDSHLERQFCVQTQGAPCRAGECEDSDTSDELQFLKDAFQLNALDAAQPLLRLSHHDVAECCGTISTLQSQHILLRL